MVTLSRLGIAKHSILVGSMIALLAIFTVYARAADPSYSPYAERAFPTELFFGETHVHSALSADAGGGINV